MTYVISTIGLFTCMNGDCNRTIFCFKQGVFSYCQHLCPNYGQTGIVIYKLVEIRWIKYFASVCFCTCRECNSGILVLKSSLCLVILIEFKISNWLLQYVCHHL